MDNNKYKMCMSSILTMWLADIIDDEEYHLLLNKLLDSMSHETDKN